MLTLGSVFGCLVLGLLVGLSSTFLGLGGGLIVVPLLSMVLDVPHQEILATSILAIFLVMLLNSIRFCLKGHLPLKLVVTLGLTASVFAFASSRLAGAVDEIILLFGALAILTLLCIKTFLPSPEIAESANENESFSKSLWIKLLLGAIIGGCLNGFVGFGAGVVLVPIMVVTPMIANHLVAPTANGVILFSSFAATLSNLTAVDIYSNSQWGLVHFWFSGCIFLGAVVSGAFGHRYQAKFPRKWRKLAVGILTLLLIAKLSHNIFQEIVNVKTFSIAN